MFFKVQRLEYTDFEKNCQKKTPQRIIEHGYLFFSEGTMDDTMYTFQLGCFVEKCTFRSWIIAWTSKCSTKIQCNYTNFFSLYTSTNYWCVPSFGIAQWSRCTHSKRMHELLATLTSSILFWKHDEHYSYTIWIYTR